MDKYLIKIQIQTYWLTKLSFPKFFESLSFLLQTLKLICYFRNHDFSRAKLIKLAELKHRFRKGFNLGQNNKLRWMISLTLLLILLTSCTPNKPTINIAVASNFESTLKKIVKQYKIKHQSANLNIISGSSGILANQIINQAPYDLFLSADEKKPQFLYKKLKLAQEPSIYAIGKLALWIPTIDNSEKCIDQLNTIDTLVIANPKTAPYGFVASAILKKHKIQVKKVIHASNISQSYLYTQNGYAQAGFVAYSMLKGNNQGCQQLFEHRALPQGMLLIDNKAQDIYDFILSEKIQLLIAEYGYNTVQP